MSMKETDQEKNARLRSLYEERARSGESMLVLRCAHCKEEMAIFISELPKEPAALEPTPADPSIAPC